MILRRKKVKECLMEQKDEQKFTPAEQIFTKKMLTWDQKKASLEVLINSIFLACAGIAIVVAVITTIRNIGNEFIIWKVLPGYAIGVLLLCNYIVGDLRIKERRRYAGIIRKVMTK